VQCRECSLENHVKAGFNAGKQRYKCKECGCFFTRSTPKGESIEKKRQAIHMYLEGLGFRAIGRVLKVSHVTVQDWVAKKAEHLETLIPLYPARVKILELDELHHYIGKKIIPAGSGSLLLIANAECWPQKWVVVEQKPVPSSGTR
jgi:transposase-like protein